MKGWVGLVGWPAVDDLPITGDSSDAGWAQDMESSPAKDKRSTTVLRHHFPQLIDFYNWIKYATSPCAVLEIVVYDISYSCPHHKA